MDLLQNEQRVLYDVAIQLMIYLAMVLRVPPESVKVSWILDGKKWMPSIDFTQVPDDQTPDQIREVVVSVYRQARKELAAKFVQNRQTRFHG
jgi:hypothetical protein